MAAQSLRSFLAYALVLSCLFLVLLGLACAGPLSDSCSELRTCAPTDASDASAPEIEATADGSTNAAIDNFVCDPSKEPKDDPCVLDDAYGLFVAASARADMELDAGDGGAPPSGADGSMSHPYATIGQALANLGNKTRIYVCNGI